MCFSSRKGLKHVGVTIQSCLNNRLVFGFLTVGYYIYPNSQVLFEVNFGFLCCIVDVQGSKALDVL